jgi:hypothetical protein
MTNVPNLVDGQVLYATDCFKFHQEDTTGGTVFSTTAETSASKITIAANTVTNGILIMADVAGTARGDNFSVAINIRCGEDAAVPANNTLLQTINYRSQNTGGGQLERAGGGLHRFYSAATWTNINYVDISVTPSTSSADCGGTVYQVTVFVF